MRSLLKAISALSVWHGFTFIAISIALGQTLNWFWPMKDITLYQILFTPAIVYALFEVQRFVAGVEEFRVVIASHPNRTDGDYIDRLLASHWYFAALLIVGGLFIYASLELEYVAINPTGIYALAMIVLVMVSAVLGQLCYLYYVLLLRRLSRGKAFKYNFFLPARTDWVRLLDGMGSRLTNAFFILGFIFTLVYVLNVRPGYIVFSWQPIQITLSTPNDFVFVVSWVVLFLIVVIAFPCYVWLQSTYMRNLVRALKDKSIEEVNSLTSGSGQPDEKVDSGNSSYRMMMDIDASVPAPRDQFNPIPFIATFSSLAVHLIKISESI